MQQMIANSTADVGSVNTQRTSWLATVKNDLIPQPELGGSFWASTEQATLETIGSEWSYVLK